MLVTRTDPAGKPRVPSQGQSPQGACRGAGCQVRQSIGAKCPGRCPKKRPIMPRMRGKFSSGASQRSGNLKCELSTLFAAPACCRDPTVPTPCTDPVHGSRFPFDTPRNAPPLWPPIAPCRPLSCQVPRRHMCCVWHTSIPCARLDTDVCQVDPDAEP